MNIGIDARICETWSYYERFVHELIASFASQETKHTVSVYTKKNLSVKNTGYFKSSHDAKVFNAASHDLMVFFDIHVPKSYRWKYILIIEDLKEVFFSKKRWLHRKIYRDQLKKSIERSILCWVLDTGTAMELNENINISEEKISIFPAFFPKYQIGKDPAFKVDIKSKHNLKWQYLIYDSWNEVHNNFERILRAIAKMKQQWTFVYVLVLCDETTKDLDIRSRSIEYGITENILYLWAPQSSEESSYYRQSSWVIFSSIYESFPFQFTKAIAYECAIYANDIPANMHVMKDSIHYLDPLSIHRMSETITLWLGSSNIPNYRQVHELHNSRISSQALKDLIQNKDITTI